MYSRMRDEMIDLFGQIGSMDISQAPNYKMMLALCNRFKADGMPAEAAERLVACMDIKISPNVGKDDELMLRAVECYGDLVQRMTDQISKDFSSNPYQILESMASQFSLHMEF